MGDAVGCARCRAQIVELAWYISGLLRVASECFTFLT